jgi:hypothetical protein
MTATIIPFPKWKHSYECCSCEVGEVCRCKKEDMQQIWELVGAYGLIQCFPHNDVYYAHWNNGRMVMSSLEAAKKLIEHKVMEIKQYDRPNKS